MIKTASIVYIPPPSFKNTEAFIQNLKTYPPAGELVIISEHNYRIDFPNAKHVSLMVSPERLEWVKHNPASGISNALFVVAMRTAKEKGYSHILYLESDCRVGQESWDKTIFHEFFSLPFPAMAAGTLMLWNICNGGMDYIRRAQKIICETKDYPVPPHFYGSFPHSSIINGVTKSKPCNPSVFPNGAGMVMNVDWMNMLFDGFQNMMAICTGEGQEGAAWDYQIGCRARDKFGPQVFEMFAHLRKVCSTYGDGALNQQDRLRLLKSGEVVIGHQFK